MEDEPNKKVSKWQCPQCGNTIKTYVPLNEIPTCHNPEKHNRKKFVMKETK